MNNLTSSKIVWNSTFFETEVSPGILVITLLLVCIWIVAINALVFVCLLMSRHALKNFVNIQMLSFSLTDMFVGVCAIPVILTYQITTAFPYFEACAGIFYGYCISQAANLFHAFGICIHRIVIIRRCAGRKETNPKSMLRKLFLQIASVWVLSVILVSIPFGLFGQFGLKLDECSLNTIFADNYIYFCACMDTVFLIPQVGMDVIYIYMFWFLFNTWRNSNPIGTENETIRTRSVIRSGFGVLQSRAGEVTPDTNTKDTVIDLKPDTERMAIMETPTVDGESADNERNLSENIDSSTVGMNEAQVENGRCQKEFKTRSSSDRPLLKKSKLTEDQNDSYTYDRSETFVECTNSKLRNRKGRKRFHKLNRKASNHKNDRKLNFERQKDVLITIGLILLVVNVFMTPLNMLVVIELLADGFLTREVKFILMAFALMNSALNPVIYALRIKLFRKVFVRNCKKCVNLMCLCLRRKAALFQSSR